MRRAAVATLVVLAAGMSGCAAAGGPPSSVASLPSSPSDPASSSGPAMFDGCVQADEGGRFQVVVAGRTISGVTLGSGPKVLVLSNESDSSLCGWLTEARRWATAGYRVVMWDQDAVEWPDAIAAVVADQRTKGARSIVLVGASKGGWASAIAAGTVRPAVEGMVSLSGEGELRGRTVYAELRRFRGPVLVISSLHDGLSSDTLTTFPKVHGTTTTTVLSVPGDHHGWELLRDENAATVRATLDAFLSRVSSRTT